MTPEKQAMDCILQMITLEKVYEYTGFKEDLEAIICLREKFEEILKLIK